MSGTRDEPEIPKHRKRAEKKPVLVEWRYVGTNFSNLQIIEEAREWSTHRRYCTAAEAKRAVEQLNKKEKGKAWGQSWEYRLAPDQSDK